MVAPVCETMNEEEGLKELQEVGLRLLYPSSSRDFLCNTLEQASALLSAIQQLPQANVLAAMKPTMDALVKPNLLKHKDEDVQFLVTACISEIMRIVAPEAPYDDDTLKDIFDLIVKSFKGLADKNSRYFDKRMRILDSVASVRSCVVMLDLECDDLIREMFQIFFSVVSEEPKNIALAMRAIMCLVLEESEEIPLPLLEVLLRNLLRTKKGVSQTAYSLARAVFWRSDAHLRPHVEMFLTSKTCRNKWSDSYHDLIFEFSQLNTSYVLPVIPKLIEELQADKLDVRLKAIRLAGRILASQKGKQTESYNSMFTELLSLITHNVVEIRLSVIEFAKVYLSRPPWPRDQEVLAALCDCIEDGDPGVRRQVVFTICNFAKLNLDLVPIATLKKTADCLQDSEAIIRQETFQHLTEVHKEFCLKLSKGSDIELESFSWIPCRLFVCYDNEDPSGVRARALELVLEDELFPPEFSAENKVSCWVSSFDNFNNKALKGFERFFEGKQRFQEEMQKFLGFLTLSKDKENQKSKLDMQEISRRISNFFVSPSKVEPELQNLSDSKLLKLISELLDAKASSFKSLCLREDLRKAHGENGSRHDVLKELALKCSLPLFDKEDMSALLNKLQKYRSSSDDKMLKASVGLMLVITKYFPSLLEGGEAPLLKVLKDDEIFSKDEFVQILSRLRGPSSVALLEKLCMEGHYKNVKYVIRSLSALCNDNTSDVLPKLYKNLLDQLKGGSNMTTTLTALGFLAQCCVSESIKEERMEVVNFLLHDLLRRNSDSSLDGSNKQTGEITLWKQVSAVKTLARSFIHKDNMDGSALPDELLEALLCLLKHGEVSDRIVSNDLDKAQLRLAASSAVLKLSTLYDRQISPQLFHATISCTQDQSVLVKHGFLEKLYNGIMKHAVTFRYSFGFVLNINDGENGILEKSKQQLAECIKSTRGMLPKSPSNQPEYVLFYLVHYLARELCLINGDLTLESIQPILSKLVIFIWGLLVNDGEGVCIDASRADDLVRINFILGVFSEIKNAVDVVDVSKTEDSYALCDTGVALLKDVLGDSFPIFKASEGIPLPAELYKPIEEESMVDKSFIPSFLDESGAFARLKSSFPFKLELVVKHMKRKADTAPLKDTKTPLYKRNKVSDAAQEEKKEKNKRIASETMQTTVAADSQLATDLSFPASPKRKRGTNHISENGEVSSPETQQEQMDGVIPTPMRKPKALKVSVNEDDDVESGTMASDIGSPDGAVIKRVHIFIKRPKSPPPDLAHEPLQKEDSSDTKKRAKKEVDAASSESKRQGQKEAVVSVHDDEGADTLAEPVVADTPAEPVLSPRGTPRRSAKIRSDSGLSPSTPNVKVKEDEEAAAHKLVGCRIRVWWPMDKKFYKGIIRSYQSAKKKHKVVYDDGDVEILKLDEERWEMLKDTKGTPNSPSLESNSHAEDSLHRKETKEARNTKDFSDTKKPNSQTKSKKVPGRHHDAEIDNDSSGGDNREIMEQEGDMEDAEDKLAPASKKRKNGEKNSFSAKKANPKGSKEKSELNTQREITSVMPKESKEREDVPIKVYKGGKRKSQ
ncbi:hypothetical protein KP509_11G037000 [Ceratopteris richardii]|uniref:Uncharacterized protein n=1 Tax=Ceratopteris richardii TaxID=49495 RepID=A0A8T2TRH8_CERRI|nr:hypothetical protein KP509_11G037000 [Ceratopteris richardii]